MQNVLLQLPFISQ